MKRCIILGLTLLAIASCALHVPQTLNKVYVVSYPAKPRLQVILTKVKNANKEVRHIKVSVRETEDDFINATAHRIGNSNVIVFNTGVLKALDDDALAFVIGHELAHYYLGHLDTEGKAGPNGEMAADLVGHIFTLRAGYSNCGMKKLFETMYKQSGETKGDTHPKSSVRIKYATRLCTGE